MFVSGFNSLHSHGSSQFTKKENREKFFLLCMKLGEVPQHKETTSPKYPSKDGESQKWG